MSSLFVIVPLVLMMLFNLCCKRTVNSVASWLTGLYFIIQSFVCIFWARFSISSELFPMFNFEVDKLGLLMMLTISIVALSSMFVGLSTISESRAKFNFLNLLLISTAGMNGVVMVRDIFSLYVFLEVTAVSSFILIALNRDNKHSLEG